MLKWVLEGAERLQWHFSSISRYFLLYKVVEHVSWTQGIGGLDDGAARGPTLLHIVCAILGERRRLRLAMFDVYEVGEAKSGYCVQLWISRHLLVRSAL